MTTTQLEVILCSDPICRSLHYAPDCTQRESFRGPAGKYPKPIGACVECWYGPNWGPHTHDGLCDLINVPVSIIETRDTFYPK